MLFGTDYYDYELDSLQNRFRPTLAIPYSINVYNPVYGQTQTPLPFVDQLEQQDATGFYLQDQIDLTEHWKVLAGVRYDDFSQDILNRRTATTQSQSQTATSPRFGLVYDVYGPILVLRELRGGVPPQHRVWAQTALPSSRRRASRTRSARSSAVRRTSPPAPSRSTRPRNRMC